MLVLAIVATGLVNLGIATAYERGYGVLKRLGGSPLGREGLLVAKLAVVASIAVAQVVVLPGPGVGDARLAARSGRLCHRPGRGGRHDDASAAAFAGLGLLIAGTVRPEAALVLANALFLVALMVGGVLVPIQDLPGPLASIAGLLPVGALAEAFGASSVPVGASRSTSGSSPRGAWWPWSAPHGPSAGVNLRPTG